MLFFVFVAALKAKKKADRKKKKKLKTRQANAEGAGGGGGSSVNTAAIVAAIRETKDVYMDGRRVTSRVASSVEKSSKNQYGFG